MDKPGIEELLIACVLEPGLLRRLRESPASILDDYELSDRAREILIAPDERLLELLGESLQRGPDGQRRQDPPRRKIRPAASGQAQSLPASRLAVRLVPYVQQVAGDGVPQVIVNYAGHLDPLPDGLDLDDLPDVPQAATDGEQLPPLAVEIAIQPTVWTEANERRITFSVNARLPQETNDQPAPELGNVKPWPHDIDSPAVKAAAVRVHEAEAGERHQRLLEMIDVMVFSADGGGMAHD